MTDSVLSQIEQILQGIETRTPHSCYGYCLEMQRNHTNECWENRMTLVRAEIARTVERMGNALIAAAYDRQGIPWAAGIRAAGGTPQ